MGFSSEYIRMFDKEIELQNYKVDNMILKKTTELYKKRELYIKKRVRWIWTKPFFRKIASIFLFILEEQNISPNINNITLQSSTSIECWPKWLSKLFLKG